VSGNAFIQERHTPSKQEKATANKKYRHKNIKKQIPDDKRFFV